MKVIDLLNKIANGEEISKFWWNGCIHKVQKEYGTNKYSIFDTYCKKYKRIELEELNEKVEVIEDKKIEKLDQTLNRSDIREDYYRYIMENRFKINEIIDKINGGTND